MLDHIAQRCHSPAPNCKLVRRRCTHECRHVQCIGDPFEGYHMMGLQQDALSSIYLTKSRSSCISDVLRGIKDEFRRGYFVLAGACKRKSGVAIAAESVPRMEGGSRYQWHVTRRWRELMVGADETDADISLQVKLVHDEGCNWSAAGCIVCMSLSYYDLGPTRCLLLWSWHPINPLGI